MDIRLKPAETNGLDIELFNVEDDEDYNLLVVRGPKRKVEFIVAMLTVAHKLSPLETEELAGVDFYKKSAFVPKSESQKLKERLYSKSGRFDEMTNN